MRVGAASGLYTDHPPLRKIQFLPYRVRGSVRLHRGPRIRRHQSGSPRERNYITLGYAGFFKFLLKVAFLIHGMELCWPQLLAGSVFSRIVGRLLNSGVGTTTSADALSICACGAGTSLV